MKLRNLLNKIVKQTTIKNSISCSGIGLHTGTNIIMKLLPAPADTGIVFIRTDVLKEHSIIKAMYYNVGMTNFCTSLINEFGKEVNTVEHFMSACWAKNLVNVYVIINGPELPSMDGSAEQFLFLLECADITFLESPVKVIEVLEKIEVSEKGAKITLLPCDHLNIEMKIDFTNKVVGIQSLIFSEQNNFYKKDIARARTFGFYEEVEELQAKGLARGGSLDNAIVIKEGKILNKNGLRFNDEFVRHKILDCIGDLYLAGGFLKAKVIAERAGHYINNLALRKLFESQNYKICAA